MFLDGFGSFIVYTGEEGINLFFRCWAFSSFLHSQLASSHSSRVWLERALAEEGDRDSLSRRPAEPSLSTPLAAFIDGRVQAVGGITRPMKNPHRLEMVKWVPVEKMPFIPGHRQIVRW